MLRSSPHRRTRTGLWFGVFTILSLLMLLASRTDQAAALQQVGTQVLEPVRAAVGGVGQGVAGFFAAIGEIDRLRQDNEQLRRQLATAEQRIVALQEAAHENAELRGLLGVRETLPHELLPARVVSRDPSNFTREIGIDAGSEDGVRVGMVVVGSGSGAGALVGTVEEVSARSARVRLVVDTRSAVIAVGQASRALGVVRGQLGGQLVFEEVDASEALAVGDAVVTAGLEVSADVRSRYPPGLLIGRIAALERDANGLTQRAFVRPAVDFDRLEHLLVLAEVAPADE